MLLDISPLTRLLVGFSIAAMMMSVVAIVLIAPPGGHSGASSSSTNSTTENTDQYHITSDPTPYFTNGYDMRVVDFSQITNADSVLVGATPFRYELPSNIETRTTTNRQGSTTTIIMTVDYQCGTSMGARRFFYAALDNGKLFKLDYCLVLNTAISQGSNESSGSRSWSLWEISQTTHPTVAIHMAGNGENVSLVELWAGRASSQDGQEEQRTLSGSLFVSDAGRSHGGFEYTASYNVILRVTGGSGVMYTNLSIGLGGILTRHEYNVSGIRVTGQAVTMMVEGHPIVLPFVANDSIWAHAYDDHYIASWGGDAPPEEMRGMITPSVFDGVPSTYYVELRLVQIGITS